VWINLHRGFAQFRQKAGGRDLSLVAANANPSFPCQTLEMYFIAHFSGQNMPGVMHVATIIYLLKQCGFQENDASQIGWVFVN